MHMHKPSYYVVNLLTLYRLIAVPVLLFLIFNRQFELFKWLLVISFLTDAVDGYLARKFNAISKLGATLDSIADDLTIGVAIVGVIISKPAFIKQEVVLIVIMSVLYVVEIVLSLMRYGKISGFHIYTAKVAAVLQGIFILLFFFLPQPVYILFYFTAALTIIDLFEEITLVFLLPKWRANVKGVYWVLKSRRPK
ncbi:MAG TPA: CDP-alcohol phosphatidyltransferase family protein [Mucilaginibacter sp.]|nr:CDP-alcohol phosphatidyltransferase family protein [Mucilaginibacter sp.]